MENACAFHMLRPANENSSKSSKPDASDLLLETNSVANTIVLLTYVVLSNILQNNRSWPQIVRLLNVSAFSVKACQHRLGTAKKKITDPLFFLYTSCMQSFYFKFHNSGELFLIWFISSWQKLVNCSAVLLNELFLVPLSIYGDEFIFCSGFFFYPSLGTAYAP